MRHFLCDAPLRCAPAWQGLMAPAAPVEKQPTRFCRCHAIHKALHLMMGSWSRVICSISVSALSSCPYMISARPSATPRMICTPRKEAGERQTCSCHAIPAHLQGNSWTGCATGVAHQPDSGSALCAGDTPLTSSPLFCMMLSRFWHQGTHKRPKPGRRPRASTLLMVGVVRIGEQLGRLAGHGPDRG